MSKPIHYFTLLAFVFFPLIFINAQVFKGIIYDNATSEPISFASVGVKDFGVGTVSNEDGKFSLNIQDNHDSIVVSHLNYGLKSFKIQRKDTVQLLGMDSFTFELEEILVVSKPVSQILLEAINTSEEAINESIYLDTYYREFVKTNDNYTKYSDGLITYFLKKKKGKKMKTKVWVRDSRAVELYDEKNEEIDWDLTSPLDVRKSLEKSLIGNVLEKFISQGNRPNYNFTISNRKISDGKEWSIISISPKVGIEQMLYSGTVAIDMDTGLIMEVSYNLSEDHRKFAKEVNAIILKLKILDAKNRIMFENSESNYCVKYSYTDVALKMSNKKGLEERFRFTSDLLVNKILTTETYLENKDVYRKKSLYKRTHPLKSNFWLDIDTIELTEEQEKIVNLIK